MPSTVAVLKALCFIIGLHQVWGGCDNVTSFTMRVDTLLAEYDRSNPPAAPLKVFASLQVRHANIYEDTASVRLLANLQLNWNDSRLAWNTTDWGCDKALVTSERLWLPDVALLSAATSSSDPADTTLKARITGAGQVSWVTRLDVNAPLSMDLYKWPADEHEIIVKFGSRGHSIDEMDVVLRDEKSSALMFESSSWEAVSVNCSEDRQEVEGVVRGVVSYTVRLRRTGHAHGLALAAVLATTTLLLLAAAMMPPDSRPALCAAAAFTSALWLISSAPKLSVSARVPLPLSLVCVQCVCACACAAAAALVLRVSRCSAPPPPPLRALLTATSQLCRLTTTESVEGQSTAWAAAARLLDRTLLLLVLLTVFIVHCIHLFH
ncbi:neuronal acetylcholine receptor subunit beta-3-like [Aricia agestis]|uniref:neuronal acetylcholine receptor subunit beta-3-like n=1 Tax=Aricia agestis TaxID=91739 RepID=UPI001C202CE6|nr:neuronal acetylcholine receptor subunit beta-3-like [Aricia agestis]